MDRGYLPCIAAIFLACFPLPGLTFDPFFQCPECDVHPQAFPLTVCVHLTDPCR
jgi:hypothetical protein